MKAIGMKLRLFIGFDKFSKLLLHGIRIYFLQFSKFMGPHTGGLSRNILTGPQNRNRFGKVHAAAIRFICPYCILVVDIGAKGNRPEDSVNHHTNADIGAGRLLLNLCTGAIIPVELFG